MKGGHSEAIKEESIREWCSGSCQGEVRSEGMGRKAVGDAETKAGAGDEAHVGELYVFVPAIRYDCCGRLWPSCLALLY